MRYLRYLFLAILAVCLTSVALANTSPVTVRLLTDDLAVFLGFKNAVTLPLFIVIFGGIITGILVGFIWEWFREHKHRAEAANQRREKERLEKEMSRIKGNTDNAKDDVLALLEG
ncbi:MAG: LapA family protein [Marinosulfonomonas sp.]|nr:LapA family protein [Marinosulfonomonas sp.]